VKENEPNYFKEIMDDFEKTGDLEGTVIKAAIFGATDRELIKRILNLLKIKNVFTENEIDGIVSEAADTVLLMQEAFFKEYNKQHP